MFEAETLGLKEIYDSHTIRVPQPICWGLADTSAYIVMEWLDLGYGKGSLVATHGHQPGGRCTGSPAPTVYWLVGKTNTIGDNPQQNALDPELGGISTGSIA